MQSKESLARQFLATLPPLPNPIIKKLVLGIVGLPGTGKSTVAQAIATRTNLYVASNDTIRRFLNTHGFPGASPAQDILEYIAIQRTLFLYDQGVSHIIDADLTGHVEDARVRAQEHDFTLCLIKVVCPEPIARARIRQRLAEAKSESLIDERGYDKRVAFQTAHKSEKHDFQAVIDTSLDVNPQIEKLINKLLSL